MVRKALSKPVALLLILLMALGSIAMWIVVPVFWIWLAAKLQEGKAQPTLGPYLLILVGIPVTMFAVAKALAQLNVAYGKVTGVTPRVRMQMPWHKSMRGERDSGHQATVLDVVMLVSVSIALVAFAIWFFLFAGSSLPT
ncbi:MAG TPA: hypothetical protein VFR97_11460 [Capillimicrobium sp.]|nr:hypothetical protein [Capillimicrobium sp.]